MRRQLAWKVLDVLDHSCMLVPQLEVDAQRFPLSGEKGIDVWRRGPPWRLAFGSLL